MTQVEPISLNEKPSAFSESKNNAAGAFAAAKCVTSSGRAEHRILADAEQAKLLDRKAAVYGTALHGMANEGDLTGMLRLIGGADTAASLTKGRLTTVAILGTDKTPGLRDHVADTHFFLAAMGGAHKAGSALAEHIHAKPPAPLHEASPVSLNNNTGTPLVSATAKAKKNGHPAAITSAPAP